MAGAYSNPMAPEGELLSPKSDGFTKPAHLTNDDFRKLVTSVRESKPSLDGVPSSSVLGSKSSLGRTEQMAADSKSAAKQKNAKTTKKKSAYYQVRKEELAKEKELKNRYRDRAKERRDGKYENMVSLDNIIDGPDEDQANADQPKANLKEYTMPQNHAAIPPDSKHGLELAKQRRLQMIEESKYLGGDIKHTHLVKGLDYALLDKVKTEMKKQTEQEKEQHLEMLFESQNAKIPDASKSSLVASQQKKQAYTLIASEKLTGNIHRSVLDATNSTLAKSVYLVQFTKPSDNEEIIEANRKLALYKPKRMTYQVELQAPGTIGGRQGATADDADIDLHAPPTTVLRSIADIEAPRHYDDADGDQLQAENDGIPTEVLNDEAIIEKLSKVLSYLKQPAHGTASSRHPTQKAIPAAPTKQKPEVKKPVDEGENIFDDVRSSHRSSKHHSSSNRNHRGIGSLDNVMLRTDDDRRRRHDDDSYRKFDVEAYKKQRQAVKRVAKESEKVDEKEAKRSRHSDVKSSSRPSEKDDAPRHKSNDKDLQTIHKILQTKDSSRESRRKYDYYG